MLLKYSNYLTLIPAQLLDNGLHRPHYRSKLVIG